MLWKFGNDYTGLLIVEAETSDEAIDRRHSWLVEQYKKDRIYKDWWDKALKSKLWDRQKGLSKTAEEILGPRPEGGITYFKLDPKEIPTPIGDTFAYMWME